METKYRLNKPEEERQRSMNKLSEDGKKCSSQSCTVVTNEPKWWMKAREAGVNNSAHKPPSVMKPKGDPVSCFSKSYKSRTKATKRRPQIISE